MIVKIWPIMADYADDPQKVGGEEGLRNTLEYITDEEKVIVKKKDLPKMPLLERDDLRGQGASQYGDLSDDDTFRVMSYMANEEKIKGKYISTYLCDQEVALEQFKNAREIILNKAGVIRDKETGALAYHIVQSFPEGLEISDEEVHQCGIELCQKIGLHQAVICSHVHPEVDEHSGEVHGKCKHNHILINAYIHPDKWDPERPGRLKYNDCDETYAQLRAWNDEIAIEHGLPIIRNPDNERSYSWKEADEENKGLSWKTRMRTDIEETRRAVDNWEDFKKEMEALGYSIRDNVKYVSYTAPDGTHTARGKKLGKEYTKQSLELYWNIRKHCYRTVEPEEKADGSPSLLDILQSTSGVLRAAVPLGTEGHGSANRYYYLPLKNVQHSYESVSTYFNYDKFYDICDEQNRPVTAATGAEILACIEALRGARDNERDTPEVKVAPEEIRTSTKSKRRYYTYALYINSRTKRPYRTSLYDENGRRRSALELLFLLAATVIKKESDLWAVEDIPKGKETDVIYAPRNWKIQSMLDAIGDARKAEVETPAELDVRLHDAGAALSRAKSALTKTKRAKEKMEMLSATLAKFQSTREIAEQILNMEEGPEKEELKKKYADILEEYRSSKAVLYRYNMTTDEQIKDFELRFAKIDQDIVDLEARLDRAKEEYRKLKKIEHSVTLAQNTQYCYGPTYGKEVPGGPGGRGEEASLDGVENSEQKAKT